MMTTNNGGKGVNSIYSNSGSMRPVSGLDMNLRDSRKQREIGSSSRMANSTSSDGVDGKLGRVAHDSVQGSSVTNTEKLQSPHDSHSTKVELSYDAESSITWVNIVDTKSGKVIAKIPPESVRKIVDILMNESRMHLDKKA